MTPQSEFDRLESHLRGSWLVRAVHACRRAWLAAAAQSATVRWLRRVRDRFASRPAPDRLRAVAVFVATATVGHLLFVQFMPLHIVPALPKTIWVLVAAAALVVALLSSRVTATWETSIVRRLWHGAAIRYPDSN